VFAPGPHPGDPLLSTSPAKRNKQRRRSRRRAIAILGFAFVALGLSWFFESQSTTTVVVVRYAETAGGAVGNPGLSSAGQQRALELARVLGDIDVDAGLDAVIATQYRRSQETVELVSRNADLPVKLWDAEDHVGLAEHLVREHKGEIVLVASTREGIPALIAELHGSQSMPEIADDEHDNIYFVSIPWFGKVKTLRLRYGTPPVSTGSLRATG
jgi:broad specificity phosphatase PhoE